MLFDSTLRQELAAKFGATLVVILTIVLTILFVRTLGQAAVGRVAPGDVLLLLAYVGLGHLSTMLALSLFVAVVASLSRMYRSSEMTIWFASGVPLRRFLRPVAATAWPIVLLVAVLALFVWPWQNAQSNELKDRFERRSDLSRVAPGQFQTSGDGQRTFFFEGGASGPDAGSIGRNVFVVSSRGTTESVTSAKSGRIVAADDGRWVVLDRGQQNEEDTATGEKTLASFETYRAMADERARGAGRTTPAKATSTWALATDGSPAARGELAWRLGLVFACANLALIGIGMSAANPRHASNWNLLFALMAFFAYYNAIAASQAWIASGRLGFGTALLAVHGGALALGVALVWWRDRGTGGVLPRRRRRRRRAAAAQAPAAA